MNNVPFKTCVIVPDGMADEPLAELGGKTPLEAANVPHMRACAAAGRIGTVQTIPKGWPPGSDIGNMALLGYDPQIYHTGRAPLEAANQNIILDDNEIAVRCNLVTVTDDTLIDYSAGHIETAEATHIINDLNEQLGQQQGLRFMPGVGYRHLLILKIDDIQKIRKLKTTPPHDILGQTITPHLPHGYASDRFIAAMEQSREILAEHAVNQARRDRNENPANMIWLWGQGTKPTLPAFAEKFQRRAAMISAVDLVNGIARLANMTIIDVPGATGYYDTSYENKGKYGIQALHDHDYVYIHIEAPDEAGHNGDIKEKIKAIEQIDHHIVGPIRAAFSSNELRILIAPDHPTPIMRRTHTADPVGFIMCGAGITPDDFSYFGETICNQSPWRVTNAPELVDILFNSSI